MVGSFFKKNINNGERQIPFKLELPLVLFILIVIVGILLRLYQINYNFDVDEIFSIKAASSSFSNLIEVAIRDRTHPPLYNFLLFLWVKVWGVSEVSARMLSVIASCLFLIVLYKLALLLMSRWSALIVLSIFSFSPFFIYYGQQARPYSLACFLVTLSVYLLLKIQTNPSTVNVVLYFFSCAALVYTQYMGVFILLPQLFAIVFSKIDERRKVFFYGVAGMLSIVFWIIFCSIHKPIIKGIERGVAWIEKPSFFDFASLYISPFGFSPIEGTTKVLVILIVAAICFIVIKHRSADYRKVIFISALALLGPIITFVASNYGRISFWAPRQVIGSIIFFVFLIGLGLALVRGWVRTILGLALITWCIFNVPSAFPENSKPPWRSIGNLISQKYPNQNIVAQEIWVGGSLKYYLNKDVQYSNNFKNYSNRMDQFVFVCRPSHCDKLRDFMLKYRVLETQTINWGKNKEGTIHIYFLEKVRRDCS